MGALRLLTMAILLPSLAAAEQGPSGRMLAELADLSFDNFGARQGLPHDSVYGFAQDSAGYLWIATFGGLARFDGYRMRAYTHDPNRPGSIPDNNLRVIVPAEDGRLWIGTGNAAVIEYDPSTDSFHPLPNLPKALAKSRIFAMTADGDGGLWFGSEIGLTHYDARAGCRVDIAANGREAVAALALIDYDLVFMDCQMPVMDGFAATRQIRQMESKRGKKRTPVIALTANALDGERERCLAAEMDDYLQKPVGRADLEGKLKKWLSTAAAGEMATDERR